MERMTDCACGGTVDEVSECKHKMILSNLPSDAKIRKTALCSKLCRTGNSLSDRSYVVWFVLPSVKKRGTAQLPPVKNCSRWRGKQWKKGLPHSVLFTMSSLPFADRARVCRSVTGDLLSLTLVLPVGRGRESVCLSGRNGTGTK